MNNGAPYSNEYISIYNSQRSPSTVHCSNTWLVNFFKRYLLNKAITIFKWENIPSHWSINYFLYGLYIYGFQAIINTDKFGVIPQVCGLQGFNVFYQPTNAIIQNPRFTGIKNLRIGIQTELIKLFPDYGGIMDLIAYYADLMALTIESASMNMVNSKLAYLFIAGNKAGAESFKKLFDQIQAGNPAVVIDKNLIDTETGDKAYDTFSQNLRSNYIFGDIMNDLKKLECEFNTKIGIPNANTEKRERLIADEVNSNNVDVSLSGEVMLSTLRESIEKVNSMFNLNISVDWRFKPEEVTENG